MPTGLCPSTGDAAQHWGCSLHPLAAPGSEMGTGDRSPFCLRLQGIICNAGDLGWVPSQLCGVCAECPMASWLLALSVYLWETEKGPRCQMSLRAGAGEG